MKSSTQMAASVALSLALLSPATATATARSSTSSSAAHVPDIQAVRQGLNPSFRGTGGTHSNNGGLFFEDQRHNIHDDQRTENFHRQQKQQQQQQQQQQQHLHLHLHLPLEPVELTNSSCPSVPSQRVDCGHSGTTKANCEASGCCWEPLDPNPNNYPWCFKKSGPAPPSPAPAPAVGPAPKSPVPAPSHSPSPSPSAGPYDTVGKAFVHLFEWSWSDVAQECEDYLGPNGFDAVQTSPPMEHIVGDQWWTRYQPVSYDLVSRSGNEDQFKDMISRCAKAGVKIYADAVVNHMAAGSGTGINGHSFGDRAFPGLYTQDDFHHNQGDESSNCVVSDYTDQHNVQYCDLVSLPDLCTGCSSTQTTIAGYLQQLAAAGVEGFRMDAAKHQEAGELGGVLSKSGLQDDHFFFHEVIEGAGEAVTPQMYFGLGQVAEFAFGSVVGGAFKNNDLSGLGNLASGFFDSSKAVVFIDNHDTQRGDAPLTYKDGQQYILATVFMLGHPYGHPKVMSSYVFSSHDQGPPSSPVHSGSSLNCGLGSGQWVCEHRNPLIAPMMKFRQVAGSASFDNFVTGQNNNAAAFSRGAVAFLAINLSGSDWAQTFQSGLPAGTYTDIFSKTGVTVGADGTFEASVPSEGAFGLHV